MKSNWFVVVDAGGNVMPDTFSRSKGGAMSAWVWLKYGFSSLITQSQVDEWIAEQSELGYREVGCELETNETVSTKIKNHGTT